MTISRQGELEISILRSGNLSVKLRIPDSLEVIEAQKAQDGFGCFRFMTPKDGDKRVVWDSRDFSQITDAKAMFDEAILQGLVPYQVGVNGRATSEVLSEFNPYSEEIIFLPVAMVAGG